MDKPEVNPDAYQLIVDPTGRQVLVGLATGHPRLKGRRHLIRTSLVIHLDLKSNRAETLNTHYILGRRIERIVQDQAGETVLVEVGGFTAERRSGATSWTVRKNRTPASMFVTGDYHELLEHLLDLEPTLEGLLFQITPDTLPDPGL
jgi:hypothetical protein